jgi:hypothetical protein
MSYTNNAESDRLIRTILGSIRGSDRARAPRGRLALGPLHRSLLRMSLSLNILLRMRLSLNGCGGRAGRRGSRLGLRSRVGPVPRGAAWRVFARSAWRTLTMPELGS